MNLHKIVLKLSALAIFITGCNDSSTSKFYYNKKGEPIEKLSSEQLKLEIDRVVVDAFFIEDTEVETAVELLISKGAQNHPEMLQLQFDTAPVVFNLDETVSLGVRNIPFSELISLVCEKARLKWEVKNGVIVFENK